MINSLELFIKKKDAIDVTKKWLDTRRSYLDKLKSQAGLIAGSNTPEILLYSKSNSDLYKRVWFKDSEAEFFDKIHNHKIVLCGDFHSSPSVKRFYLRLFKRNKGRLIESAIMALECVSADKDDLLQSWLKGDIDDEKFLKLSNWDEAWGFSWKSYKKFILEVKDLGFEIRAVNSAEEDFHTRDLQIAKNLEKLASTGKKVFCLIGQHHIGPENLTKQIYEETNLGLPFCLHLDSEELYFALEEYNLLKDVQVLSLENHFCFLSTPPWVHWQNHLLHLDDLYEDDDEDEEDYDELRGEDYNVVVFDYVQLIKKDLGITNEIGPIDVAFIDEYVVEGQTSIDLYNTMAPLLYSETSFYWPEQFEGIMTVNSLNQAASVAGKYVHASLMEAKKLPWGDVDSFEAWCWLEAVGHMLSKFINPKRLTIGAHNVSAFLSARLGKEEGAKLLKSLIKGRVLELDQSVNLSNPTELNWSELVYAARLKGALVGEGLFDLYSRGKISAETLRTYLTVSIEDKKRFKDFYALILQRLEES